MINIAVDGFAGCGKSTLVKILADKLGDFKVLDTGAIFRAFAFAYLKEHSGLVTDKKIGEMLEKTNLKVEFIGKEQHVFVNSEDATSFLRTEEISALSSKISAHQSVRDKYLEIARDFASKNDCLMEGRDIGTVVLPNANVKLFLTADLEIRAKRRFKELQEKGEKIKFEDVLKEMKERDERDTKRKVAPLVPAEDAFIVDNSEMNLAETVDYCFDIIKENIKEEKKINIAIDGLVCSGKSSIAKALARELGFKIFDTGAVYRGIACAFDYMHYDESKISNEYICKFSKQINITVEFFDDVEHVLVNGIDYTPFLRTERTSSLSAKLSPFVCIRNKVLALQRAYAKNNNIVMEGRDIGSTVLPNADFKFFCTADESVRAQRRFEQQKILGNDVSFEEVFKQLKERDFNDIHRDHGALQILPEAIVIDTTNQNLEQSVKFCLNEIKKKYPDL